MAKKRMFSLDIIDTDLFIEMPQSSRLLYYELCMRADDDGFVSSPKKIMKMVGCSEDDLKVLITKQFIIPFDTGIVVIKHWKIHNYIQKDRYKETIYTDEKDKILVEENGMYTKCIQECIQNVYPDKNRLDKNSIDKNIYIVEQVINYLNKKIGSDYKKTTKSTISKINARQHEGFNLEDFKTVIDKKYDEWYGTDMEKYLRPDTLFGTKFESYLNQKNVIKKETPMEKLQREIREAEMEEHND